MNAKWLKPFRKKLAFRLDLKMLLDKDDKYVHDKILLVKAGHFICLLCSHEIVSCTLTGTFASLSIACVPLRTFSDESSLVYSYSTKNTYTEAVCFYSYY